VSFKRSLGWTGAVTPSFVACIIINTVKRLFLGYTLF
jgi:hypothetical protein